MKHTVVVITNQLEPGGAEKFCLDMSQSLINKGYSVILFAQEGIWLTRVPQKVEYINIPLGNALLKLIPIAWRIRSELRKRPAILGVLANSMVSLFAIRMAYPLQRLPVIQVAHGWPPGRMSVVGPASRLASRVLAVSDNLRHALIEAGCNSDTIYHVPNGVDCDKYRPEMTASRRQWRYDRDYSEDDCVLLSVARFETEKRPDRLSSLAVRIKELGCGRLRIHAIGIGSLESELQHAIATNKLQSELKLENGSHVDISAAIAGADLFLNTSDREGMPLSVLEGLAGGLPLIGDKNVLPDLLDTRLGIDTSGWVYEKIISEIGRIWSDQNQYRMLSQAAREYALRHKFSSTVDAYEKHLWEIALEQRPM